jgi:hypothetical protein
MPQGLHSVEPLRSGSDVLLGSEEHCLWLALEISDEIANRTMLHDCSLTVLDAGGLLALLKARVAEVALIGRNGHVGILPLASIDLPGTDFGDLDATVIWRETVLLLARDLTDVAASAELVVNEKSTACHGYSPFFSL